MGRRTQTDLRPARHEAAPFLSDVLRGLARRPREIPSRWLYDAHGTLLFQWISRLPAYYLSRTERTILDRHAPDLCAPFAGRKVTVVDLGAGDGHKTLELIARLREAGADVAWAPVDVSEAALAEAADRARAALPDLRVRPVRADYLAGLKRVAREEPARVRLVLFLGSSIGNLEPAQAERFLRGMRIASRPGDHALVGFDLVKDLGRLHRAYDDPQGVTRAFNLNLLARMNRELGADADLAAFRHVAGWDPIRPAMVSWLECLRTHDLHVSGRTFRLLAGERIRTEISCKYVPAAIEELGGRAGFERVGTFRDSRGWFEDALWRVPGEA
jgi:L-histidine N-alpha-methyltransferase